MNYETTDPASEIAALFSSFSEIPNSDSPTLGILSSEFDCDPSTSEWYELLGAMATRIRTLREFVENVDDRFVKDKMRSHTITSLDHMTMFLQPSNMNKQWVYVKTSLFTDDHISRLESFAAVAEKYRPLRKLDAASRESLIEKLDELLNEVGEDHSELPEWAAVPIIEGIRTLRRVLAHFAFFGHQSAIDALLNLTVKLEAVAESDLPDEQKQSAFDLVRKTMHIVFFVGELILLPANAYQGYHVYKDVALEHLMERKEETLKLVNDSAEQRALPSPSGSSEDEEKGEVVAP